MMSVQCDTRIFLSLITRLSYALVLFTVIDGMGKLLLSLSLLYLLFVNKKQRLWEFEYEISGYRLT